MGVESGAESKRFEGKMLSCPKTGTRTMGDTEHRRKIQPKYQWYIPDSDNPTIIKYTSYINSNKPARTKAG